MNIPLRRITKLTIGLALLLLFSVGVTYAADTHPAAITYEVTITNLTTGQALTPPLLATHTGAVDLFTVGDAASLGIQEIAENGNLGPAIAALSSSNQVFDVVAAGAPLVPAGTPGAATFSDSVTLNINTLPHVRYLSYASMLICTNDGFTGVDALELPRQLGQTVTVYGAGYDAGTEINTEDFADIVPPCQGLIGVSSDDAGTGMSNPALAEGGVITHHAGIQGGTDLLPEVHGWTDPVVKINVTRVAPVRHYEVTIENLTGGQALTPPLLATHSRSADVFTIGEAASFGVKEIAENGNLAPLQEALGGNVHVFDVVAAGAPLVPAGTPGSAMFDDAVTLTISADRGTKFLSYVSMLICTNDGFTGLDALQLPEAVGDTISAYGAGYDAGTEINTEDFADIVPPCQGLIGISSDDVGTGMSNPELAEGGVIMHHDGIWGGADLVPEIHGWDDPVIRVTVTRID
jgi:hypothetical protein